MSGRLSCALDGVMHSQPCTATWPGLLGRLGASTAGSASTRAARDHDPPAPQPRRPIVATVAETAGQLLPHETPEELLDAVAATARA